MNKMHWFIVFTVLAGLFGFGGHVSAQEADDTVYLVCREEGANKFVDCERISVEDLRSSTGFRDDDELLDEDDDFGVLGDEDEEVDVVFPETAEEAAELFGGEADWWFQIGGNGWVLRAPRPIQVTVPDAYRLDIPGATCEDGPVDGTGIYGPEVVMVQWATEWLVGDEEACGAVEVIDGQDAESTQFDELDVDAPDSLEEWVNLVNRFGNLETEGIADEFGGVVVEVDEELELPEGFEAVTEGHTITDEEVDRILEPGVWTIYPPCDWRDELGFTACEV